MEYTPAYLVLPVQALLGVITKHIPRTDFSCEQGPSPSRIPFERFGPINEISEASQIIYVLASSVKFVTQKEPKVWLRERLFLKLKVSFRTIPLLKLLLSSTGRCQELYLLIFLKLSFCLQSELSATAA